MPSRPKPFFFFATAAVVFFISGWACNKYSNKAGISADQVVASVDGKNLTFGDWMKSMDLTSVFITDVDPTNPEAAKAVLKNLIDQQLILNAAQKENFSDPQFNDKLSKQMTEADINLKDEKDRLDRKLQTILRLQKDYKESLEKLLLANQFAKSKANAVPLTEKDLRDWYADYSAQAAQAGQAAPPFEKIKNQVKSQFGLGIQREKFVNLLEAQAKIHKNDDIIDKYVTSLSAASQILDSGNKLPSVDLNSSGKK
jgi:hypothetical protein